MQEALSEERRRVQKNYSSLQGLKFIFLIII
uniref:Uncharacterized protein n=1 Tax=Anguilla anguilla TaxID=7936 RepID=A0A0E9V8J9_ANGAN